MPFAVPTMWRRSNIAHTAEDCYICVNYKHGVSRKTMKKHVYRSVSNVTLPVPHSNDIRPPERPDLPQQALVPENGKNNLDVDLDNEQ